MIQDDAFWRGLMSRLLRPTGACRRPTPPRPKSHTDAEWRSLLKPDLRSAATRGHGIRTSPLLHEKRRACSACGMRPGLFSSTTKFEAARAGPFLGAADRYGRHDEGHVARSCGLRCIAAAARSPGHVFRWAEANQPAGCMNGVAMTFKPRQPDASAMTLFVLAYLGGVLTIVSLCILRSCPSCLPGPIGHSSQQPRCSSAWSPPSVATGLRAHPAARCAVSSSRCGNSGNSRRMPQRSRRRLHRAAAHC